MNGTCNRQTRMWELDQNDPNTPPWHPPPSASKNLRINELHDIRKLTTKEHNKLLPVIHTEKLEYTQVKLDINKWHAKKMNSLIDHNKQELANYYHAE